MKSWWEMGCAVCRRLWESSVEPPEIAESLERQARLHRCEACGAYWEVNMRCASEVTEAEARQFYPEAFATEVQLTNFTPMNSLEHALVEAEARQSFTLEFQRLFLQSDIAVPSGDEVMPDGRGFQPVLYNKEGVPMVACFTSLERIDNRVSAIAPYCLMMNCAEFLRRIPVGYGLVLNPGHIVGFDIDPDGLRRMIAGRD